MPLTLNAARSWPRKAWIGRSYFLMYATLRLKTSSWALIFVLNSGSMQSVIEPTFVAPTAVIEKNPNFHDPSKATRSFSTNRLGIRRAAKLFTENKLPAKWRRSKIFQSVGS